MQNTFPERHYLDLFAGPGRCVLDDGSGEIDGSPLVALGIPFQFTEYHFIEVNPEAMLALRTRVARAAAHASVTYHDGDANDLVESIVATIPKTSLNVALVDPTGLHLRFETLRRLTEGRRMDLIYVFPEGMAVKRNIEKFLEQRSSPLDELLGTTEWRPRAQARLSLPDPKDPDRHWDQAARPIVEILHRQLTSLGYMEVRLGSEIVVRNRRNVPLYYLVFASKHPLGHRFWNDVRRIDRAGQTQLPLQ